MVRRKQLTGWSGRTADSPAKRSSRSPGFRRWPVILMLAFFCIPAPKLSAGGWTQKDFIITMWCWPPETEESFAQLQKDGFNMTGIGRWRRMTDIAAARKTMDLAAKYNLRVIVNSPLFVPAVVADAERRRELDAFIAGIKDHPALAGYYLTDEPGVYKFEEWSAVARRLYELDPGHFAYVNLYPVYASQKQLGVFQSGKPKGDIGIPDNFAGVGNIKTAIINYNEYLEQYIRQFQPRLLSYDHYHFLKDRDGEQYFLNLEMVRSAASRHKLPFLNVIQACTIEKVWRMPDRREMRFLAYSTMAYGGRGISWFLHWGPAKFGGLYQDGKRMPSADDVAAINREVGMLGGELMRLESTGVYQSAPLLPGTQGMGKCPVRVSGGKVIVGMFRYEDGIRAFLVVNRDYQKAATVSIRLADRKEFSEYSPDSARWLPCGKESQTELPPGGGKLFRIGGRKNDEK